ncbi:hypothetical protein KHA80_06385 [Anaerobacillus sp. HL2]|nr:hypothetical protein KHA80_06385 [Anaerobacillus sp. HL2]
MHYVSIQQNWRIEGYIRSNSYVHIDDYNKTAKDKKPYIIVCIDENLALLQKTLLWLL